MLPLLHKSSINRITNTFYLDKNYKKVWWDGKIVRCQHKKEKRYCKDCGGSSICKHNRNKSLCKDCGGISICYHNRVKSECKDCGGSQICEHNRIKSSCKDCGGSKICEHNKRKSRCKDCGGNQLCKGCHLKKPLKKYISKERNYINLCADCFHIEYPNEKMSNQTAWFLLDYMRDNYKNYTIEREKRFDWCVNTKTGYILPCDYYIEELNLVIELHGRQHYIQVSNWESPEIIQERDEIKKNHILNKGYKYYSLDQEDVWNDKNMWKEKLNLII